MTYFIALYVLFLGACVGSFLNVCIYRIPEGKSIVFPGSACPYCSNSIQFYDNIPIISYFLLLGKCRMCNHSFSIRYMLVELMTAVGAWCIYLTFGFSLSALVHFAFLATLIVITFIDIDHQIIPDRISLPGILVFFAASIFLCLTDQFSLASFIKALKHSLIGILCGGGSLLLVGWGYELIRKRSGMGGGDIKLLAMIGALVGWPGVMFTIYVASIAGTMAGCFLMIRNRKKDLSMKIPFGPFLAIGAVTYIFWGDFMKSWYFGVL